MPAPRMMRPLARWAIGLLLKDRAAPYAKRLLDALGLEYVTVSVPQRIGHLALEADCYLRDRILRDGHAPLAVMIEPGHGGFANPALVEHLSRYMIVIPRDARADALDAALRRHGYAVSTAPYAVAMYETALSYDVFRRWGTREPLFSLTEADRQATAQALERMGVPKDAWYVCVHARAGGYSPSDEHWHLHRNVEIADYFDAMDLIAERGGWCIRMGDATMAPMPPRTRTVDYALSPHKSARVDIGLTAGCRFFLGCASGLYNVAAMFGRPSALANVTPLSGAYALGVNDLAIPQLVADADGRLLPLADLFATDVANFRLAEEFAGRRLVATNVSPGEIADLTRELMDRLDGSARYDADDQARQEKFRGLLRQGHYAFGTGSRIGRDFLRRHLPLEVAA